MIRKLRVKRGGSRGCASVNTNNIYTICRKWFLDSLRLGIQQAKH